MNNNLYSQINTYTTLQKNLRILFIHQEALESTILLIYFKFPALHRASALALKPNDSLEKYMTPIWRYDVFQMLVSLFFK